MALLALTVIVTARRVTSATLTIIVKHEGIGWIERSSNVSPNAVLYGEEDELMISMTSGHYDGTFCELNITTVNSKN